MYMLDLLTRAEFIDDIINEIQQLANQIDHGHFFVLAKVDHLALQSITHGAPLVFLNQHPAIQTKAKVSIHELVEFGDNSLKQRGNRDGVVNTRRNVADAKFQGWEERMGTAVPPNLFAVVDAARLD